MNSPEAEELIKNIERAKIDSSNPESFEKVIDDVFSFLGFNSIGMGGKGRTDVLITAELGPFYSYKATVEVKTNRDGIIHETLINQAALDDHKETHQSNYIIIVGGSFAKGRMESWPEKYGYVMLDSNDIVSLIQSHSAFPVDLLVFKKMFDNPTKVKEFITLIERETMKKVARIDNFTKLLNAARSLQESRVNFSAESIAGRVDDNISTFEIKNFVSYLTNDIVRAVNETEDGKYFLTMRNKEIKRIFNLILGKESLTLSDYSHFTISTQMSNKGLKIVSNLIDKGIKSDIPTNERNYLTLFDIHPNAGERFSYSNIVFPDNSNLKLEKTWKSLLVAIFSWIVDKGYITKQNINNIKESDIGSIIAEKERELPPSSKPLPIGKSKFFFIQTNYDLNNIVKFINKVVDYFGLKPDEFKLYK